MGLSWGWGMGLGLIFEISFTFELFVASRAGSDHVELRRGIGVQ